MPQVEEIDCRRVLAFEEGDLQFPQKARRGHPEIVAHHHDALDAPAVTLAQRLDQLGVFFCPLAVEPLLELVQDDQHLLARRAVSPAQLRQGFFEVEFVTERGTTFAQSVEQPCFRFVGSRLDVHRQNVLGEAWKQTGLHERRFPRAGRTVDQTDGERYVRVGLLDPALPKSNALGQPVPVFRAGQQFQKEIGVLGVKRS